MDRSQQQERGKVKGPATLTSKPTGRTPDQLSNPGDEAMRRAQPKERSPLPGVFAEAEV